MKKLLTLACVLLALALAAVVHASDTSLDRSEQTNALASTANATVVEAPLKEAAFEALGEHSPQAGSCGFIRNRDMRALCEGNCGFIRDSDMQSYCRGNCGFIRNKDLKSFCEGNCGFIRNNDLKSYCEGSCGFIRNGDLKNLCSRSCGFIRDADLKSYCEAANKRFPFLR